MTRSKAGSTWTDPWPVLDEQGQRKMIEVPQYELVTSHAARRTFVTYLVSKGIPTRTVMSMTGHKVESEFNKYVNMNGAETAMKVNELAGSSQISASTVNAAESKGCHKAPGSTSFGSRSIFCCVKIQV
jgi:hypothetical protein